MDAFTEGKTVMAGVVMVAVVTVRRSSWGLTLHAGDSRRLEEHELELAG